MWFDGARVDSAREWGRIRARRVGYVFQAFHLLPTMTAQEAIASVNTMDDPERAKAQMRTEKRRSALDALGQKKKELTGGNE